jgi:hypothetical protein
MQCEQVWSQAPFGASMAIALKKETYYGIYIARITLFKRRFGATY